MLLHIWAENSKLGDAQRILFRSEVTRNVSQLAQNYAPPFEYCAFFYRYKLSDGAVGGQWGGCVCVWGGINVFYTETNYFLLLSIPINKVKYQCTSARNTHMITLGERCPWHTPLSRLHVGTLKWIQSLSCRAGRGWLIFEHGPTFRDPSIDVLAEYIFPRRSFASFFHFERIQ